MTQPHYCVQCLIDKSALSRVFRRVTSDRVNREVSPSRSLLRNRSRILGSERKKQDRSGGSSAGAARRDGGRQRYCASFSESRFRRLISRSSAFFEDTPASISGPRLDKYCDRHRAVVIALTISCAQCIRQCKRYLRNAFRCDPRFSSRGIRKDKKKIHVFFFFRCIDIF